MHENSRRENHYFIAGSLKVLILAFIVSSACFANPPDNSTFSKIITLCVMEVSQHTQIKVENLSSKKTVPVIWGDSCLSLNKPEELCAQVMTQGYEVTLTDGTQNWSCHTNSDGTMHRVKIGDTIYP